MTEFLREGLREDLRVYGPRITWKVGQVKDEVDYVLIKSELVVPNWADDVIVGRAPSLIGAVELLLVELGKE